MKKTKKRKDFESVLFRWSYFTKAIGSKNDKNLDNYDTVISAATSWAWRSFSFQLLNAGLEKEDVFSLARIHTYSYAGVFSLKADTEKLQKFVEKFKELNGRNPTVEEIDKKDKADAYRFVQQRLMENSSQIQRKNMGFCGRKLEVRYFLGPEGEKPSSRMFLKKAQALGFVEITKDEAQSLTKKLKTGYISLGNGKVLRVLSKSTPFISDNTVFNESDSFFGEKNTRVQNITPEDSLIMKEEMLEKELLKKNFKELPVRKKVHLLSKFLKNNSARGTMLEEKNLARKILSELKGNGARG